MLKMVYGQNLNSILIAALHVGKFAVSSHRRMTVRAVTCKDVFIYFCTSELKDSENNSG